MENYYQVMGVSPDASHEAIKIRYRFLARAYHPDRFSDNESKAQAENEMKRVNEAYSVLSNPEKRNEYDNRTQKSQNLTGAGSTDYSSSRKVEAVIKYLEEVEKRWKHTVEPFDETSAMKEARQILTRAFILLVDRARPSAFFTNNDPLIHIFSDRLYQVIRYNMCLGAEYEQNGFPFHLSPVEIQAISAMPLQQLIFKYTDDASGKSGANEKDMEEMLQTFGGMLVMICEQSQVIGHAKARKSGGSASTTRPNQSSPEPEIHKPPRKPTVEEITGCCQTCGAITPTENVTFRQNIGVLIMRYYQKIEGALCADCIENYFWQMTGTSLLLGWWGIISFITTPFILLVNVANYLKAWNLRQYSNNLGSIAVAWKLLSLTVIGGIAYYLLFVISPIQPVVVSGIATRQSTKVIPTRIVTKIVYITATPANTPTPTPAPIRRPILSIRTPDPSICKTWNQISTNDQGKVLCVYGEVKKVIDAPDGLGGYHVIFTNANSRAFRIVIDVKSTGVNIIGHCVITTGLIRTNEDYPYIRVLFDKMAISTCDR